MIMPTKHKLSIALTASLLFTTGCSGARLKNLIGRNDYQTLEELEREDSSYADLYDDADEKDSRFVSQTREIDEPVDPLDDLEDEQPRSRFGFGRLFGRDKDDDYAAMEDPFAGTLEDRRAVEKLNAEIKQLREQMKQQAEEKARPVVQQATERDTERDAEPARQADQYVASLDEVEQQAEAMFDDLSRATDGAYDRTAENPFARASRSNVLEETVERTSESFSDFLNQSGAAAEPSNPFAEGAQAAVGEAPADLGLNFDALVSESDREAAYADAVARQDDLFPEAGDVFADALGFAPDSIAAESVATPLAATTPDAPDFADAMPADLAAAAENHGFAPLKEQDPWAAFAAGQAVASAAAAEDTTSGFQWGQPASTAAPLNVPVEADVPAGFDVLQVSSDETSPFATASQSAESPLMIPAQVPSEQPVIELPMADIASEDLEDPFLMESGFADLEQIPAEELATSEPSADAAGTGGPATITTMPNRLWFFVLGCVALAALLFLPSRQSQKN